MARVAMYSPMSSSVQPSYSHTRISHLIQMKYTCVPTQTSGHIALGSYPFIFISFGQ